MRYIRAHVCIPSCLHMPCTAPRPITLRSKDKKILRFLERDPTTLTLTSILLLLLEHHYTIGLCITGQAPTVYPPRSVCVPIGTLRSVKLFDLTGITMIFIVIVMCMVTRDLIRLTLHAKSANLISSSILPGSMVARSLIICQALQGNHNNYNNKHAYAGQTE
jgi:hypothetical protein